MSWFVGNSLRAPHRIPVSCSWFVGNTLRKSSQLYVPKGYVLDDAIVSGWDAKDAREEAWERAMLGEDGSGVGDWAASDDEAVAEAGMTEEEKRERDTKQALTRRYEKYLAGEGAEPWKEG